MKKIEIENYVQDAFDAASEYDEAASKLLALAHTCASLRQPLPLPANFNGILSIKDQPYEFTIPAIRGKIELTFFTTSTLN